MVTAVHVLFEKPIPERSADYFRELDEETVKIYAEEQQVSDFDWPVVRYHMDKGLLYKPARVVVRIGLIVACRSLVTAGRQQVEDKHLPISLMCRR